MKLGGFFEHLVIIYNQFTAKCLLAVLVPGNLLTYFTFHVGLTVVAEYHQNNGPIRAFMLAVMLQQTEDNLYTLQ